MELDIFNFGFILAFGFAFGMIFTGIVADAQVKDLNDQLYKWKYNYNNLYDQVDELSANLSDTTYFANDYLNLLRLQQLDTHTYIKDTYDCKNFSSQFRVTAVQAGYEVYIIHNYKEHHAYNCIAFEPQTGEFIKANYTGDIYINEYTGEIE